MSVADVGTIYPPNAWETVANVVCVICPGCGFTFDVLHQNSTDDDYTCPACAETKLEGQLRDLQKAMDEVVRREAEFRSRFTVECEACRGEGTQVTNWQPPHGCNGYYEKADCSECDGSGRIPKRSDA